MLIIIKSQLPDRFPNILKSAFCKSPALLFFFSLLPSSLFNICIAVYSDKTHLIYMLSNKCNNIKWKGLLIIYLTTVKILLSKYNQM